MTAVCWTIKSNLMNNQSIQDVVIKFQVERRTLDQFINSRMQRTLDRISFQMGTLCSVHLDGAALNKDVQFENKNVNQEDIWKCICPKLQPIENNLK